MRDHSKKARTGNLEGGGVERKIESIRSGFDKATGSYRNALMRKYSIASSWPTIFGKRKMIAMMCLTASSSAISNVVPRKVKPCVTFYSECAPTRKKRACTTEQLCPYSLKM